MKKYCITGLANRVDKFFEICNSLPLVSSSWPYKGGNGYEGDHGKGFGITLSPTLKHGEFLLYAICAACEIKCVTMEGTYESELKDCKEMLRYFLQCFDNGHMTITGLDVGKLRHLAK